MLDDKDIPTKKYVDDEIANIDTDRIVSADTQTKVIATNTQIETEV